MSDDDLRTRIESLLDELTILQQRIDTALQAQETESLRDALARLEMLLLDLSTEIRARQRRRDDDQRV